MILYLAWPQLTSTTWTCIIITVSKISISLQYQSCLHANSDTYIQLSMELLKSAKWNTSTCRLCHFKILKTHHTHTLFTITGPVVITGLYMYTAFIYKTLMWRKLTSVVRTIHMCVLSTGWRTSCFAWPLTFSADYLPPCVIMHTVHSNIGGSSHLWWMEDGQPLQLPSPYHLQMNLKIQTEELKPCRHWTFKLATIYNVLRRIQKSWFSNLPFHTILSLSYTNLIVSIASSYTFLWKFQH